jgi:hypothetical protein
LTFHKRLTAALERLEQLKSDATQWFRVSGYRSLDGDVFVHFVRNTVRSVLQKVANELLLERSISPNLARSVMASMIGHSMINPEIISKCTLCWPDDHEGQILRSLEEAKDAGGEYQARRFRLATHLNYYGNWARVHKLYHDHLVENEFSRCFALSTQIVSHVVSLFERYKIREFAETAWTTEIFYDESVGYWLFERGREQQDCLKRSTLHQWLDYQRSDLSEDQLHTLRNNATLFALRHQDILGRTPLDIARTKGWADAIQTLLDCESSQTSKSRFGNLPIQYSSANNSDRSYV